VSDRAVCRPPAGTLNPSDSSLGAMRSERGPTRARFWSRVVGRLRLVEQNASLALQIADRAYVLVTGWLTISGPAAQLLTDERVRKAYLAESGRASLEGHAASPCLNRSSSRSRTRPFALAAARVWGVL
jgi:hypothetical protein